MSDNNPDNVELCYKPVKGGGVCQLGKGHTGYHSTVVFYCEGCGRIKRGRPTRTGDDGEFEDALKYCWTCVRGHSR